MLKTKAKTDLIQKHSLHEKDTGSSGVQVALLTKEIELLTKHLKKHQKDNSSRRGLLKMVSKRKKLLDYLKEEDPKKYNSLTKELGLRK